MKKIAIIGGGISGLSALHFLTTRFPGKADPVLFEKEARLGGTIGTDRINGFISDWGPNGFLDKIPLTLQMVEELGAGDLLEKAHSRSGKRFIYVRGKLQEISTSPIKFLKSPLLSLRGRMRLVSEPFIRPRRNWDKDETVFDFAVRRIGREAAETLIDPMTSGIFGGDARQLSLRSCFPLMVDMERKYGSLVKALIARKKESGKLGQRVSGPAGPGGTLTSFTNGLNTLIEIFEARYRDRIRVGCKVVDISKKEAYQITFSDAKTDRFDVVICATPAYVAARQIERCDREISRILESIPYASISVVCLGYRREDIGHDLDGFGFLVPRGEDRRILGTIWTSSIFNQRSPDGMVQMRTMIGGATDPEAVALSDEQQLDIVTAELERILSIKGRPVYVRIFKYARGIPQFTVGHSLRIRAIEKMLEKNPGLYLVGNAYDGVGLNDCVLRSEKVVLKMSKDLGL